MPSSQETSHISGSVNRSSAQGTSQALDDRASVISESSESATGISVTTTAATESPPNPLRSQEKTSTLDVTDGTACNSTGASFSGKVSIPTLGAISPTSGQHTDKRHRVAH